MPAYMGKKLKDETKFHEDVYDPSDSDETYQNKGKLKNIDRRRKVHVTCEHRRRKEIQDALDALEAELPINAKPRSKAAIIVESAEMIKELTFALDQLLNDNQILLNRKQVDDLTK